MAKVTRVHTPGEGTRHKAIGRLRLKANKSATAQYNSHDLGSGIVRLAVRSRRRIRSFNKLPIFDDAEKIVLTPLIRRYVVRGEAYSLRELAVSQAIAIPLILIAASITLGTLLFFRLTEREFVVAQYSFLIILGLTVMLVLFTPLSRIRPGPLRRVVLIIVFVFTLVLTVLIGAAFLYLSAQDRLLFGRVVFTFFGRVVFTFSASELGLALLRAATLVPTAVVVILLLDTIRNFIKKRVQRAFYPDVIVVNELLDILIVACSSTRRWADFGEKQDLLIRLERVATFIEQGFPRRMRTGDPATDLEFRQQAAELAAAIRSLKRWVVTPNPDTRDQFIRQIGADLSHALRGEWNELPQTEPKQLTGSQRLAQFFSTLKILVIGSLPLIALVAMERVSQPIADPYGAYLKVGALLWLAVTYISLLDSSYATRLTAVKDLADLFRRGKQ